MKNVLDIVSKCFYKSKLHVCRRYIYKNYELRISNMDTKPIKWEIHQYYRRFMASTVYHCTEEENRIITVMENHIRTIQQIKYNKSKKIDPFFNRRIINDV